MLFVLEGGRDESVDHSYDTVDTSIINLYKLTECTTSKVNTLMNLAFGDNDVSVKIHQL